MPLPPSARSLARASRGRQLALVVALDERRSLRQAAADLAMTQPAATKLLRDLEDAVGRRCSTRHAWGMSPTAYGETMVRYARGIPPNSPRRARRDRRAGRRERRACCASAASPARCRSLVAPAIRRMQRAAARVAHPRAGQRERGAGRGAAAGHARRRRRARCRPTTTSPTSRSQPLGDEPLTVVARAGHPLARARRVALGATRRRTVDRARRRRARCAATSTRCDRRRVCDSAEGPDRDGLDRRHPRAAAGQRHGTADAARRWRDHYGGPAWSSRLRIDAAGAGTRYELVTRARRELAPGAQAFVQELRGAAGATPVRRARR